LFSIFYVLAAALPLRILNASLAVRCQKSRISFRGGRGILKFLSSLQPGPKISRMHADVIFPQGPILLPDQNIALFFSDYAIPLSYSFLFLTGTYRCAIEL